MSIISTTSLRSDLVLLFLLETFKMNLLTKALTSSKPQQLPENTFRCHAVLRSGPHPLSPLLRPVNNLSSGKKCTKQSACRLERSGSRPRATCARGFSKRGRPACTRRCPPRRPRPPAPPTMPPVFNNKKPFNLIIFSFQYLFIYFISFCVYTIIHDIC